MFIRILYNMPMGFPDVEQSQFRMNGLRDVCRDYQKHIFRIPYKTKCMMVCLGATMSIMDRPGPPTEILGETGHTIPPAAGARGIVLSHGER